MFKEENTGILPNREPITMTGPANPDRKGKTEGAAERYKQTAGMFGGSGFFKPKPVLESEAAYAEQLKVRDEALNQLFGAMFNIMGNESIKPSALTAFNRAWTNLHKLSVNTDEKPGEKPVILNADLLRLAILVKQKILATRQPNWDVATYTDKTFDSYHTVNVADYERSTFNEASPHTFLGFQNQNEKGEYVITQDYFAKDPEILKLCTKLGYNIPSEPKVEAEIPAIPSPRAAGG